MLNLTFKVSFMETLLFIVFYLNTAMMWRIVTVYLRACLIEMLMVALRQVLPSGLYIYLKHEC